MLGLKLIHVSEMGTLETSPDKVLPKAKKNVEQLNFSDDGDKMFRLLSSISNLMFPEVTRASAGTE